MIISKFKFKKAKLEQLHRFSAHNPHWNLAALKNEEISKIDSLLKTIRHFKNSNQIGFDQQTHFHASDK